MVDFPAATRIAVDVGGTFVDALALDGDGRLRWAKVPNREADPRAAIAFRNTSCKTLRNVCACFLLSVDASRAG